MLVRRVILLLLLGAAATLAVAWTCALLVPLPGEAQARRVRHARTHIDAVSLLPVEIAGAPMLSPFDGDVPGQSSVHVTRWSGFGGSYFASGASVPYFPAAPGSRTMGEVVPAPLQARVIPWLTGDAPWPGADVSLYHGARGWPFLAFWCEFRTTPGLPWVGEPIGGIPLPWPRTTPSYTIPPPPVSSLPFRPLWPGLAADTVIYAGAWWALLGGARRARAGLRIRRNLCPHCGYDRRGLESTAVCPECGKGATTRRTNGAAQW